MPESRLKRTRDTLPSGYQFGDGRRDDDRRGIVVAQRSTSIFLRLNHRWRPPHENAAERLKHWNTIEPD